jgi:hypothetical protein
MPKLRKKIREISTISCLFLYAFLWSAIPIHLEGICSSELQEEACGYDLSFSSSAAAISCDLQDFAGNLVFSHRNIQYGHAKHCPICSLAHHKILSNFDGHPSFYLTDLGCFFISEEENAPCTFEHTSFARAPPNNIIQYHSLLS